MRVTVLLLEDHRIHAHYGGEPIMCDEMPWPPVPLEDSDCDVSADIEIRRWVAPEKSVTIHLCRKHADVLTRQLRECIELLDARDLSGWTGEEKK